jgi:tetratricopeptide (TPR) repeat protein
VPAPVDAVDAAAQLHVRGRMLTNQGRPRDAERVFRHALALLAGRPAGQARAAVEVRVLNTLAYVEYELYGFAVAMSRLDQASGLLDDYGLDDLRTALHSQRGAFLLRAGRLTDAVAEFDRGVTVADDAPAVDRCAILQNRAVAHMESGRVGRARTDLARCVAEAAAHGLTQIEVKATHNLGYVEFLSGDLPSALRLMDAAFEKDPSTGPGIARLGKAQVLVEAGLYREADDTLQVACEILRRDGGPFELAEAELERARCALARGELPQARRLAASARDRFRRRGNDPWRRNAEVVVLQADVARGRAAHAVAPARSLMAELRAERLRLPARVAGLIACEAQLSAGNVDAAAAQLAEVGRSRQDDPITGRMHSHYVHARVDAARGAPGSAARRIRRALDELARYQASFGSIDLRTASAVHGRRLAELDVELALKGGRPGAVFAAVERARAVSSRLPMVLPPDDPVAAELLAELRQTLESLRAAEQDTVASEPLLRSRRDLEGRIVARSWTVSGSGSVERPASLGAVRARLAERDRSLVTYVQAGDLLTAVVVGARLRVVDLGPAAPVIEWIRRTRADLDVLADPRLPGGIRAAVRASLRRSLGSLDAALLGPLQLDGPLVVISTGMLGELPWASLPSLRGCSLVVAPSATKWLTSTAAGRAGRVEVTAISGPDLGRGDDEAAAVRAVWTGAQAVVGSRATTAALSAAMSSSTVLHVAAHGVHQPENPLFSSVRMADGAVFAHELDRQAHAPNHVVLSACEVGLATVRPGDEALGLASVLLHLGSRSVIAGVARVGDEVAAETMARYHSKLARGRDSSVALAEALVEIDADVTPPFVNFGADWAADLEPVLPVA